MGFLEGMSRVIYGIVLVLFLLALLPFMYNAMQGSSMWSDPVLQGAGMFTLVVFALAVVYVAFFRKDEPDFPNFPLRTFKS